MADNRPDLFVTQSEAIGVEQFFEVLIFGASDFFEKPWSQDFDFAFLRDFLVSPCSARCLLTILDATSSSRPG
jgi:hypothetical protein